MNHEDLIIKKAEFSDLDEILHLQKKAFLTELEAHGNLNIEPLRQSYDSICEDFNQCIFLKALYKGRIIGSVKFKENEGTVWIGKLIVDQDYRGNGLGKRLLKEVELHFSSGVKFQLFTAASSIHNIRLYESVGYKILRKYTDLSQSGLEMVEMRK